MILRFCYWVFMKTSCRPLRYRKLKKNNLIRFCSSAVSLHKWMVIKHEYFNYLGLKIRAQRKFATAINLCMFLNKLSHFHLMNHFKWRVRCKYWVCANALFCWLLWHSFCVMLSCKLKIFVLCALLFVMRQNLIGPDFNANKFSTKNYMIWSWQMYFDLQLHRY